MPGDEHEAPAGPAGGFAMCAPFTPSRTRRRPAMMLPMPDDHCSKCCPVKPPKPEAPAPWPLGALLWLGIILGVGGGAYLLVMWVVSSAF
ncbi:hypothetical protein AB0D83_19855 [Streptomyces decoyicus]|uniref:hypothetical protein n=1 Tax=Streptomyces decoyicus TaxID=249567 RepID=UPI00340006FD